MSGRRPAFPPLPGRAGAAGLGGPRRPWAPRTQRPSPQGSWCWRRRRARGSAAVTTAPSPGRCFAPTAASRSCPRSSFTKPKVLTGTSTLKFIPEELALFCRDFRLLRFYFHENGLAPQAFRVANAIAQAREAAAWLGDAGEGRDGARPEDEDEEDEDGSSATLLFESLRDWEKELKRLGAAGWRVSAVNERFDMAPSLPRYLWVPSGLLDHDLKRLFAHFEERRVPRLCWHHPGGSALLRAAAFHAGSEPGSEDARCLEALLLGGRGPCVLVRTAELPGPADIQLAHLKLRALCLPGAAAEEKWLSALEGTRWLDHVRSCLRKAVEVASLLAGRCCSVLLQEPSDRDLNCLLASLVQLLGDPHSRTLPGFQSLLQREWVAAGHPFPHRLGLLRCDSPWEEAPVFLLFLDCTWQLVRQFPAAFGFTEAYLLALHDSSFTPYFSTFLFSCQRQRDHGSPHRPRSQSYRAVSGGQEPSAAALPEVWEWGLRYSRQQRERFRNPAGAALGTPGTAEPQPSPASPWPGAGPGPVFVLTKGALSAQPLPWRSGRPPPHHSHWEPSLGEPGGGRPPPGLLLPCTAGPSVRLWTRCYLRGLPEAQVPRTGGPGHGPATRPPPNPCPPIQPLSLHPTLIHPSNPVSIQPLSIHPTLYPPIQPLSIHPTLYPSNPVSTHPTLIHPSNPVSIQPLSIHPTLYPPIQPLSIHPTLYPSNPVSTHPTLIHPSNPVSIQPLSIHPTLINPSNPYPSIQPCIHPSNPYPSIQPCIHPTLIHPSLIPPSNPYPSIQPCIHPSNPVSTYPTLIHSSKPVSLHPTPYPPIHPTPHLFTQLCIHPS
ncbi:myotubularin-related protein 11 isoform X3 [Lathamus discolor]|uniref:myotubularin-related protein 11 isoform X3 n=1 Tax=Lathamus discolor TaxID=678569 RepID=UPI0032B76108